MRSNTALGSKNPLLLHDMTSNISLWLYHEGHFVSSLQSNLFCDASNTIALKSYLQLLNILKVLDNN